jgi:pyruvate kinase
MREARVRIVATLGPATRGARRLAALAAAGVDVFRVNGAHEPSDAFPYLLS